MTVPLTSASISFISFIASMMHSVCPTLTVFGTVSSFDGMETGRVIAHVTEGHIKSIRNVFVDETGENTSDEGHTRPHVISRELPFKSGDLYNLDDGKKALRDIFLLQLFDNV